MKFKMLSTGNIKELTLKMYNVVKYVIISILIAGLANTIFIIYQEPNNLFIIIILNLLSIISCTIFIIKHETITDDFLKSINTRDPLRKKSYTDAFETKTTKEVKNFKRFGIPSLFFFLFSIIVSVIVLVNLGQTQKKYLNEVEKLIKYSNNKDSLNTEILNSLNDSIIVLNKKMNGLDSILSVIEKSIMGVKK